MSRILPHASIAILPGTHGQNIGEIVFDKKGSRMPELVVEGNRNFSISFKNWPMWKYYALFSALFAGITAVLAKIGLKSISGNLATAVRTTVVLFIAWGIVLAAGQWSGAHHLRHLHPDPLSDDHYPRM